MFVRTFDKYCQQFAFFVRRTEIRTKSNVLHPEEQSYADDS